MEALASIDFFNLDDTAFPSAHGIYSLHAKPAVAHEPRNYLLGHAVLRSRKRCVPKPIVAAALRHSSDRARTRAQLSLRNRRSKTKKIGFDLEAAAQI
jgi:hypothetical protein